MKNNIRYVLSVLLTGLFVVFALLAPQTADRWYDSQTLGQLSREKMEYQSCEITPYASFSDQMKAIALQITMDTSPYAIQLGEREDAPTDQELAEIASGELKKLYELGVLPERITIDQLASRKFYQLYAVPVESSAAVLQDVCFWTLSADTKCGNITIALDRNFKKIYALTLSGSPGEILTSLEPWVEEQEANLCFSMTSAWCSYWELQGAQVGSLFSKDKSNAVEYYGGYGMEYEYKIFFTEGIAYYVWNRLENPLEYEKKGDWMLMTGMDVLLEVM